MGKTTKTKSEFTEEETILRFLKLKVVRTILGDKSISDQNKTELLTFFRMFPYEKCYDQICKNVAIFIKHDLNDFYSRLIQLRKTIRNSKEWHLIQMGEQGAEIFKDRYLTTNMLNKIPGYSTSKSGLVFFKKIDELVEDLGIVTRPLYGDSENNNHEYRIKDKFGKWFSYDYTIKEAKIIIEYHGEHCHPNKTMTLESWNKWKHVFTKELADIVYDKDMYKQKIAEEKGFKYIVVWYNEAEHKKLSQVRNELIGIKCDPYIPKTKRFYVLTTPEGTEMKATNTALFRKQFSIKYWIAQDLIHGRRTEFNGFKIRKIYEPV